MIQTEYVYVRRLKDGMVLDIPKRDLEATLKRGFELVQDTEGAVETNTQEEQPTDQKPVWICLLCEKEFKTEKGMIKHESVHR